MWNTSTYSGRHHLILTLCLPSSASQYSYSTPSAGQESCYSSSYCSTYATSYCILAKYIRMYNILHYKNVLFLTLVLQLDEPCLPLIPGCTLSHFDHASLSLFISHPLNSNLINTYYVTMPCIIGVDQTKFFSDIFLYSYLEVMNDLSDLQT